MAGGMGTPLSCQIGGTRRRHGRKSQTGKTYGIGNIEIGIWTLKLMGLGSSWRRRACWQAKSVNWGHPQRSMQPDGVEDPPPFGGTY